MGVWILMMPREVSIVQRVNANATHPLGQLLHTIAERIDYAGEVMVTSAEWKVLQAAKGTWQHGYEDQVHAILEAAERSGN